VREEISLKKFVLMITIAIVSMSLLAGCNEIVNVESENEVGVEAVSRIIDNRAELGEILGANLTQVQITDIIRQEVPTYSFADLHVFFIGDVGSLNLGMPEYGMFTEVGLEHIIRANIVALEMVGLSKDDVQRYWVNYRESEYESYQIDLYQLREPRADGSNMLLYAGIGEKIRIDVESIIAE
jgi:hypothetical protein